jgi:titin
MIRLVSILAAPTAIAVDATKTTSRTLALSWVDNANSETGYRIYATPAGGTQRLVASTNANISSATITGLNPATTYTIVVEAYGPSAVAASDPFVVTTLALPLAPSTASAVISSTARAIDITWAASQDPDVTGYAVYRSDNLATPLTGASNLSAATLSFRDTAGPVGASFSYNVVALRARAGVTDASTPASSLTLVTPSLPAAPTALAASVVDQTVTLRWSASATATAQQVYRQSGTGAFVAVGAPLAASATSFTDANLVGASYTYRVDASNWAGTTASSVSSSVNVVSLGAATAITATANASNQPVLSWTDNAGGESGYQIRRRAYTISATNGAMTVGAWSTLTAAAAVAGVGSKGSYTDTTAVANTTYMYELAPLNGAVVGAVANSPHALALNGGLPRMGGINTTTASVVGTAGQVVVTWTASTNVSVAGYELTRCNSVVLPILGATQVCSNAQVKLGNAVNSGGTVDGRNTVTFTDTTVARNTSYVYNIRLLGGAGTGIAGPQLVLGKTASVR